MAGSKKSLKAWEKRALTSFENKLADKQFVRNLESIKKAPRDKWELYIVALIQHYNLTSNSYGMVEYYLLTEKVEPAKATSTVCFLYEPDLELYMTEPYTEAKDYYQDWLAHKMYGVETVALLLNPETTRKELNDYLDSNWSLIKRKLKEWDNRHVGKLTINSSSNVDEELFRRIVENGEKPRYLIADYPWLTPKQISNKVSRLRKRKNPPKAS